MTVSELAKTLNLNVLSGSKGLNNEVIGGYVSDLLSDVIGNAKEGQIWITLQTHHNIIAVASLKEIAAIVLVKGLSPDEETIIKSNDTDVPVLSTTDDTFTIAGKLFELINKK